MRRMRNCLAVYAALGVLGMLLAGAQAAQASTLGKTTMGASDGGGLVANTKRVNSYQLTVSASVSKLNVYLSPSGTPGSQVMEGVIYADAGGAPGALVAQSQQISFSSTSARGWVDLPFASAVALSPGRYWLGIDTGATGTVAAYRYDVGSSSRARLANDQTYQQGGASDPFGAIGWGDDHEMSLYATYTTTPAWALQSLPEPTGFAGQFSGISCVWNTACTAVGFRSNGATDAPLAERSSGTSWSIRTIPTPAGATDSVLNGVSCASSTDCFAVGSYQNSAGTAIPLAERWNGTSWSMQTTPQPAGAIGSALYGVSCLSSTDCFAVGSYQNGQVTSAPWAERWNGTTWVVQTVPDPAGTTGSVLNGVSCASSAACTAVGDSTNSFEDSGSALAERWNGTSWSIQDIPNPPGANGSIFDAVSCPSSTDCTAVGTLSYGLAGQTWAERWTGTTWSLQTTPAHSDDSVLSGVSCVSSTACTAVGETSLGLGPQVTLAERSNGTSWSIQASPNPGAAGQMDSSLSSLACRSSTKCVAVGSSTASQGPELPLVERYQ